mgnify:CR=1 FL=1
MEELSIKCGKVTDSLEVLKSICMEKSEELTTQVEVSNQSATTVAFWTEDFPELICVARFNKNDEGKIVYELDFSESTL